MLAYHKECNADATIAVIEVPMKEASRFGIMNTTIPDGSLNSKRNRNIRRATLASMGIYIFNWKMLRKMLYRRYERSRFQSRFRKRYHPCHVK